MGFGRALVWPCPVELDERREDLQNGQRELRPIRVVLPALGQITLTGLEKVQKYM